MILRANVTDGVLLNTKPERLFLKCISALKLLLKNLLNFYLSQWPLMCEHTNRLRSVAMLYSFQLIAFIIYGSSIVPEVQKLFFYDHQSRKLAAASPILE